MQSSQPKFRLVSYNIHRAESAFRRREIMNAIHETLALTDADILCLQEDIKTSDLGTSDLAEACRDRWGNAVFEKTVVFPRYAQGNTILTHLPVKRSEHIDLSVENRQPRCAIYTELELPENRSVGIVCVHLGLRQWERQKQMRRLHDALNKLCTPETPLVMAGDFNDWRKALSSQVMASGLKLATKQKSHHPRTYPAFLPVLSLDRVYYRGLSLNAFEVLAQGRRWGKSDHLPLLADFYVPPFQRA